MYRVTANGKELEVHGMRVSACPLNRLFEGEQRDLRYTERAYWLTLDTDRPLELTIEADKDFSSYELRPQKRNFCEKREGRKIVLTVCAPMQFILGLDGVREALHIFVNRPSRPPCGGNVLYFAKGEHHAGLIWLESGQTLYLEEGARVYGAVYAKDAENIQICGRGVIDSSPYRRYNDLLPDGHELQKQLAEHGLCEADTHYLGNLTLYHCRDVSIEGVAFEDAPLWSVTVRNGCENVVIDNVKIIGQWRYNADGIDICTSENVTVRNCFVRSFDDCIVARAAYLPGENAPVRNLLVQNCVLWCDWGKCLEVWGGNIPAAIINVAFEDCCLVRLSWIAMSITTMYGSEDMRIENISYKNIFIDEDKYFLPPVFVGAGCPDPEYSASAARGFSPFLVCIRAEKLGRRLELGSQLYEEVDDLSGFSIRYRNIAFENIAGGCGSMPVSVMENTDYFKVENLLFVQEGNGRGASRF